ncbi:MAG: LLM class flavin-dependent oxidoreductase [Thaumarchaeota archaeon]|nr:LLM class flavin-dependent oxidoreductase [Nitrososphaerota archaeon]
MFSIADCGLMLEPQLGMGLSEVLDWARYAEDRGYGFLRRSDHFLPTTASKTVDSAECWTSLGAVAAETRRIKFGPLVTPVGFRNPVLLAKMACTLGSFSEGRLELGLGAGWFKEEYEAYGLPFPGFKTRVKQFEEALKIIRPLTEGKRTDFDGTYFHAHTEPSPKLNKRMHLIIGGKNPAVLMAGGGFADEWNILNPIQEPFGKLREVFRKSAGERRVWISQMGSFFLGEDLGELRDHVQQYMKRFGVAGDVDSAIKRLLERGSFCGTVDEFVSIVNRRLEMELERFYFQLLVPEDKRNADLLSDTLKNKF